MVGVAFGFRLPHPDGQDSLALVRTHVQATPIRRAVGVGQCQKQP